MERNNENFKKEFKKRLYKFTLSLIELIDKLPNDNVSRRVGNQLLRSGTSIIGNHTEGQSARQQKDFTNYMNTSLKSANESMLCLSILKDTNISKSEDSIDKIKELTEIANIFGSILLTLRNKR
jgi:four helix bundle protein